MKTTACTLILLFTSIFTFGQEVQIIEFPINFITNPFNPEECELSQDYDSIFTPISWIDKDSECGRLMSSSGIYGYHNWQFCDNDTLKITTGSYNPYTSKFPWNSTKTAVTYKFDKENKLLFIKYSNGYESVLKPFLYHCENVEVLVLHSYPKAKWNTPVKKILKRKAVSYEIFFRYKVKKS